MVYPNPYNGSGDFKIGFDVTRPADKIRVIIFTTAYRKVVESLREGYFLRDTVITLQQMELAKLSGGTYYAVIRAEGTESGKAVSKPVVVLVIR